MEPSEHLPSLTSAMEDYLEAIYLLEKERRIARVRDIANRLGVKMSSVISALKTLSSRGLIRYDPHQYITLTEKGAEKAKQIVRTHGILKRFLVNVLHVDDSLAEENACRMEHHLDREVIERLVTFVEFAEMCPVDQTRWIDGLAQGCDDCLSCLENAAQKVRNRAKAQQAAIEDGMTLAEVEPGAQVMISSVKGSTKLKKALSRDGLESGAIARVEKRDEATGSLDVHVKGYRLELNETDAAKILVKPV